MKSHILINIKNDNTVLCYVSEGEKVRSHVYGYGYSHGDSKHLFLEGMMYMLEQINTVENIPLTFRLKIEDGIDNPMRHKMHWYKAMLESYNYTQFDTDGNANPCVIIDNDERYKKINKLGLKV